MAEAKGPYQSPAVACPSLAELTRLSEEMKLQCTDDDLQAVEEEMKYFASELERLSQLAQPSLPVSYPRIPGYRPVQENNPYNAWYWRCDIKGADTGKLAGKTFAIKDNIAVAGVPMMNGSKILEGYTPEFDATVVTRILDAGGRIVGKANCEHLCLSGSSFTCDAGPVRNPLDETRTTGGPALAAGLWYVSCETVASGEVDMALGGDQGGSIRIPASWCGIVGLKPTFGLVPYTGAVSNETTLDHLGPMTKTVADCALLLEVLAGYDQGRDPRQYAKTVVPEYSKLIDAGISGKKIGVLKEGFDVCTEPDVVEKVRREVDRLKEAGAEVEEVSLPIHLDGPSIWTPVRLQGAYKCLIRGNGTGQFWKGYYPLSIQESICRGLYTRPQDIARHVKKFCLIAENLDRHYQNKFYAMGQNMAMVLTKAYDQVLEQYDVLVMPTLPHKAPKLPKADDEQSKSMAPNTVPFNSTGHPALSINAGFSEGLPVGMQIVGRHFDETTVLQVARTYEKLRDMNK